MSTDINRDKLIGLLDKLEKSAMDFDETKATMSDVLKLINEAESLLQKGHLPESFEKYSEAKKAFDTIRISHHSEPLASQLLLVELVYLIFLFLLFGVYSYTELYLDLWDDNIAMNLKTVWFGALAGITIAIYGIYEHVHLRNFDP